MRKLISYLLVTFFISSISYSQIEKYAPKPSSNQVIKHSYYWLSYSETHEQAEWVFYELSEDRIRGSVDREDNFKKDPKVHTGSASLKDYKGSGYDRGHLCPAADNKINKDAMSESFYMSNMSPQEPSFNRGIWKKLEGQFRDWTATKGALYVVTAGVLTSSKGTIGDNNVAIPKYYYKIALDTSPEHKAIAFLLPNSSSSKPLSSFVVSVDSIEAITGIDFFYKIENQKDFESSVDLGYWDVDNSSGSSSGGTALQCQGIAKSTGVRCRNKTNNKSGHCYLHESQISSEVNKTPTYKSNKSTDGGRLTTSVQCSGTTKKGSRCRNKTLNANRRCHLHQ